MYIEDIQRLEDLHLKYPLRERDQRYRPEVGTLQLN